MKQLHFTKAGTMWVAYRGRLRLVAHDIGPHWQASVFRRYGKDHSPVAQQSRTTKAAAIEWLAEYAASQETVT